MVSAIHFDELFNTVTQGDEQALLYKGQARQALRYADFRLEDIDNLELATKIIRRALFNAESSAFKGGVEKDANMFQVKRPGGKDLCPRCKSSIPMRSAELLDSVAARYCPSCRLTEIVN